MVKKNKDQQLPKNQPTLSSFIAKKSKFEKLYSGKKLQKRLLSTQFFSTEGQSVAQTEEHVSTQSDQMVDTAMISCTRERNEKGQFLQ